ncbi:MAG: beta-galactosidase [Candidatus Nanoarchaeia archaeon]|nr:beta-galactosidase [Candidatus Jingweiarchaeum tengchongense]
MFYGSDYYPEHWPEERWEIDARLMHEAHMNIVRMAEFAWSKIEPEEGKYDFKWLDKAIDILSKYGIKVVLGTPTAAPPKWLIDKYPDILPIDANGLVMGFGSRRHYCPNNPHYHEYTRKIVRAMAEHYKDNSNVLFWQIDNEFGCHESACYCDNCLSAFRNWLKEKYGTIENLNNSWGTVFWSQTYNDWNSVINPRRTVASHNPSLLLDYERFISDSFVKYQKIQIDVIKEIIPTAKITHNFMGQFNQIDYYNLAKELDFVSWDNYPIINFGDITFKIKKLSANVALSHDITRGLKKKNFWVMEQQSGPTGWEEVGRQLKPGEMRLWVYQSIAHGADAIVYFRWRASTFGTEEYWHGILDHDAVPRRRYDEVKLIGKELKHIEKFIEGSVNNAEVAIIRSFDNEWAFEIQPHKRGFRYMEQLKKYYNYFYERNIQVDIVKPDDDLGKYKLVIAPGLIMVNDRIAKNILDYVKQGGIFLTTFRAGAKRWDNRMNDESLLGPLKEILGIDIDEYGAIPDGEEMAIRVGAENGKASSWYDVVKPDKAKVLGEYSSGYIDGKAVFTVYDFGKGKTYYVGTVPDDKIIQVMMDEVVKDIELKGVPIKGKKGVEIVNRVKEGKNLYFVLNFNDKESIVTCDKPMNDILSDELIEHNVYLKPLEVRLLTER